MGIPYKESTNEIWRSRENVIGFWSIVMNLIAFGKRTNQRCLKLPRMFFTLDIRLVQPSDRVTVTPSMVRFSTKGPFCLRSLFCDTIKTNNWVTYWVYIAGLEIILGLSSCTALLQYADVVERSRLHKIVVENAQRYPNNKYWTWVKGLLWCWGQMLETK